jgi:hypothetical protein
MLNLLFAVASRIWHLDLWYALPAIVAVSLVYGATRHERMGPIMIHSARVAVWIVSFMAVVFVVLELVDWCI